MKVRPVVLPLVAAAVLVLLLWPASWFMLCGNGDCLVTDVRSAAGVPLPTGATSAVPAVLAAGIAGALLRSLLSPGRRSPSVVLAGRSLLPLVAAVGAVVLLYPVSPWSECDDLAESCPQGATSLVGIQLPAAMLGTLPAAVAAGLAWWAVDRLVRPPTSPALAQAD